MTISTIPTIMARVKYAEPDSPIAVFNVTSSTGDITLDAVFADTVHTLNRIQAGDTTLVGVFHKLMFQKDVREKLIDQEALNARRSKANKRLRKYNFGRAK